MAPPPHLPHLHPPLCHSLLLHHLHHQKQRLQQRQQQQQHPCPLWEEQEQLCQCLVNRGRSRWLCSVQVRQGSLLSLSL